MDLMPEDTEGIQQMRKQFKWDVKKRAYICANNDESKRNARVALTVTSGGVTQANIYNGTAPDSQMLLVQLIMGKRGKTG